MSSIRELEASELPLLASLLAAAYGAERKAYFNRLLATECAERRGQCLGTFRDGQLVGGTSILNRTILVDGDATPAAVFANGVVAPAHRGAFLYPALVRGAADLALRSGFRWFVGFSRRAADYRVLLGGSIVQCVRHVLRPSLPTSGLDVRTVDAADISELRPVFDGAHYSSRGSMVRTTEDWRHLRLLLRLQNVRALAVRRGTHIVAYALWQRRETEMRVWEVVCLEGHTEALVSLLRILALEGNPVVLDLPHEQCLVPAGALRESTTSVVCNALIGELPRGAETGRVSASVFFWRTDHV